MEGRYPSGKATDAKRCPSGALVKAVLLNGAMDMARIADGSEQYPNKIEGWGRLNLDRSLYVEGEPGYRRVRVLDFWMANGLAQGESFCRKVKVGSAKEPLHVTLVWTDPPPANVCHKSFVVNDLDLTLTQGAALYYGNFFNRKTRESQAGGGADPLNNVEQILINSPSGEYVLRVSAKQVQGRGAKQGFALVVSGDLGDSEFQSCADKDKTDVELTETMDTTCFQ